MSARGALIALFIVLAACGPTAGGSENAAGSAFANAARPKAGVGPIESQGQAAVTKDWTQGCPPSNDDASFAIGQSEGDLSSAYGKPAYSSDFVLGRSLNPSNQIIVNVLPLPANADRIVREIGWTRAGCSLTVWLIKRDGAWVSVQASRTPSDAEF